MICLDQVSLHSSYSSHCTCISSSIWQYHFFYLLIVYCSKYTLFLVHVLTLSSEIMLVSENFEVTCSSPPLDFYALISCFYTLYMYYSIIKFYVSNFFGYMYTLFNRHISSDSTFIIIHVLLWEATDRTLIHVHVRVATMPLSPVLQRKFICLRKDPSLVPRPLQFFFTCSEKCSMSLSVQGFMYASLDIK